MNPIFMRLPTDNRVSGSQDALGQLLAYLLEEIVGYAFVFTEEGACRVIAHGKFFALELIRGARFFNKAVFFAKSDQLALATDALVIEEVELGCLKRRGNLVLHHLYSDTAAHHLITLLNLGDATDIEAHACIKLQGFAARRRFGISEHDADLHADLIDENDNRLATRGDCGQLT